MRRELDKTQGEIAAEARDRFLCGLLMSAGRYVEAHAGNSDNHPQSREAARQLLLQIKTATGR